MNATDFVIGPILTSHCPLPHLFVTLKDDLAMKMMTKTATMFSEHNDNEEDIIEEVALPNLMSIWDCPQMKKAVFQGQDDMFVAGWTCGWCPGGKGSFRGDNTTKALAHADKILGKNVRPCEGNIPQENILQYRNLYWMKTSTKPDRSACSNNLKNSILDMQSRVIQSMRGC
jgi:hypothetical protein